MARKDGSILNLLVECPWWVSVALSGIVFLFLRFVLPAIEFQNLVLKALANGASQVAVIIALLLLLPAPIPAINAWQKRKRLDTQKDLDSIRALSWREFEELVGEAYRRQGYTVSENTDPGPDEGIDLTLKKNGDLVLVQCKHWRSTKVGVNIVREMYGVMTAKYATRAILITSGFFTQEAKNFAADKPIDLVDGPQLLQLIGQVQKDRLVSRTAVPASVPVNLCPECGGKMVMRAAKRGPNPGEKFWGCSNFPRCRYTKPVQ